MFTYNKWVFSPTLTVAYYYGIMMLMVLVNIWFCLKENERMCSLRNMIGNYVENSLTIMYKLELWGAIAPEILVPRFAQSQC